jgi:hypothetical protein
VVSGRGIGRGKKITLKGAGESVLVVLDFILGIDDVVAVAS